MKNLKILIITLSLMTIYTFLLTGFVYTVKKDKAGTLNCMIDEKTHNNLIALSYCKESKMECINN